VRDISRVAVDKSLEMDRGAKVGWLSRLPRTCAASRGVGMRKAEEGRLRNRLRELELVPVAVAREEMAVERRNGGMMG
jgi:hypothetical protein